MLSSRQVRSSKRIGDLLEKTILEVILLSVEQVAIKHRRQGAGHPQYSNISLRMLEGSHRVPKGMSVGTECEYNYMVMELIALEHLITSRE